MPPKAEKIKPWLEKAARDRQAAEMLLTHDPPLAEVAGFHCQQAVEKLLKAFLVSRDIEFEKTHDLRRLTLLCASGDSTFMSLLDDIAPLTAFAVRFRYPGPGDPSVEEAQEAVAVVKDVWAFVLERLPDEAAP